MYVFEFMNALWVVFPISPCAKKIFGHHLLTFPRVFVSGTCIYQMCFVFHDFVLQLSYGHTLALSTYIPTCLWCQIRHLKVCQEIAIPWHTTKCMFLTLWEFSECYLESIDVFWYHLSMCRSFIYHVFGWFSLYFDFWFPMCFGCYPCMYSI